MAKKKICQINNLRIYKFEQYAPSSCKYNGAYYVVEAPDGRSLEKFEKFHNAKDFCLATKDFTSRTKKMS